MMRKFVIWAACPMICAGCAGQQLSVTTACADLAPLQPLITTAAAVVPDVAAKVSLTLAQAAERGVCLNPEQAQALIDQLNAAIAAKVNHA